MNKTIESKQLEKLYIIKTGLKVTIWEARTKARETFEKIMDIDRFIMDGADKYAFDTCVSCFKSKTNKYCCDKCIYCLDVYFNTDVSDSGVELGVKFTDEILLKVYGRLMGVTLKKRTFKELAKISKGMRWLLGELMELLDRMEHKIEMISKYSGKRWGF